MSHCSSSPPYGHLIHHQSGPSIIVRQDDIHAGDVVTLSRCHFKGKKGLVSYHDDVEEAIAIVLEHEIGKKDKIKLGLVGTKGRGGESMR